MFDRQTGERLGEERLLVLTEASQSFDWPGVDRPPALSLNRGFSAPVLVERTVDRAELALLAAHDDDPAARFEAVSELVGDDLAGRATGAAPADDRLTEVFARALDGAEADPAFTAELLTLPTETVIADRMLVVEPAAIAAARDAVAGELGAALADRWRTVEAQAAGRDTPGWRALRALAIAMLTAADEDEGAAVGLGAVRSRRWHDRPGERAGRAGRHALPLA